MNEIPVLTGLMEELRSLEEQIKMLKAENTILKEMPRNPFEHQKTLDQIRIFDHSLPEIADILDKYRALMKVLK